MILQAQMQAPSFTLPNQDEIEISLRDLLGKTLVLYFYPKDNTAGCSLEAQDFSLLLSEFEKCQSHIVGISPDSPKSHKNFIQKKNLKLMLLSDTDKKVASSYGAFGEKKLYGKSYMGIIRSTFVISPEGLILKTFYNVRAKGHAKEVLDFIQQSSRILD